MPNYTFLAYRARKQPTGQRMTGPKVKHGEEIIAGPYPDSFAQFVGQTTARNQILAAIGAATVMDEPMNHMLLASGQPGVGKTALARLTAYRLGAGMVELSGLVTDKDAANALKVMKDGDVLLIDEIHRLVSHGKAKAEWLLTLLQDGELHLPTGVFVAPKITIIAATTDKELLPQTILDRFALQPILEAYTQEEAVRIAQLQAGKLGFGAERLPMPENDRWLAAVASAARHNPRRIGKVLTAVRDIALSTQLENLHEDGYDISLALEWNGLTTDGITRGGQDYLLALLSYGGLAGLPTLKALLNEEQLAQTERDLIQDGYVIITPRGRTLTDYGQERALMLANKQEEETA